MLKIALFALLAVVVQAQESSVELSLQQLQGMLLQQCKNNNAENKAPEVEEGFRSFVQCIQGLINTEELDTEIKAAKSNGTLDEVFKKYCDKTPQLKACIHTLMDKVAPCVDTADREHFNDAKNTTNQMIQFICQKDGDRIALFIAEGGPECFRSKADDMKACADNFKESFSDIKTFKALNTAGRCGKFDELSACIVSKLETCSNPTPANMAESLFKYARKGTPCHTALPPTV